MRPRALILGLSVLAACHAGTRAITDAVRDYDAALIVAFRTGDTNPVRARATDAELHKIEALIDLKRASRIVLESEMTAFEITSLEHSGPDGAVVRTTETWRYHDRALDPGRPPAPVYVAKMTMQYDVERRDGVWRVARVRTLGNEYLEPQNVRVAEQTGRGGHE